MSWNPLTGCRHGCPYCYARRTAHRFDKGLEDPAPLSGGLHVLEEKIKGTPYPYGFEPTLHRYRLNQPERVEEPQTVFVCSMADLFGKWVPTSWIAQVIDACLRAPQHRYLFLTQSPSVRQASRMASISAWAEASPVSSRRFRPRPMTVPSGPTTTQPTGTSPAAAASSASTKAWAI